VNNVVALPIRSLRITLNVSDPEVLHELEKRDDGAAREAFAAQALRLGVLSLRQASGSLDADVVRREGEQLLSSVGTILQDRTSELSNALARTMVQYLDPTSGALPQRIEQLMKPNGDLDKMLAKHVGGDQSIIASTLAKHIGEQSPLFKMLSPTQSDGLLATLSRALKAALDGQREEVLKQFSLDSRESALSRLLAEVTTSNGHLRGELAADVGRVVSEFSLDNEDGALSRLVARVEQAQATIVEEFSLDHEGSALQRLSSMLERTSEAVETSLTLDDETSPLARLKREILDVLAQHKTANVDFQTEVRSTLETFKTRREEAARSTLHGNAFEDVVGELLENEAKRVGDVCERVGATPGRLQRKFGDYVLELGPESAAPGARIVFEAKSKKRYTIKNALAELAEARKNRDADVGVFVFDRASAPERMDPVHRIGGDLLVVWDAEDATTDTYFRAAFSVARTLAHRERVADSRSEADLRALDQLIEQIAGHAASLDSIEKAARSVKKNGDAILSGAETIREALDRQVEALRAHVSAVRATSSGSDSR
jgi:hypothetical protein